MVKNNLTTNELIQNLFEAEKSQYDFTDIVNLKNGLNRCLYVSDIDANVGDSIHNYIRFFNDWDDENEIPVEDREPIKLYINSNGGDLIAGFSIIDTIRLSKTPVWTINIAAAYSAGFFIFINGHKRIAYKNSSFLFHEGSVHGAGGDAHKFRNFNDFYQKQLNNLKNIVLDATNFTDEEYESFRKDDYWLDANEALEHNVCDEVI